MPASGVNPANVPRRPVLLIIMDGMAINPCRLHNAVAMANTPNLDAIYASSPTCLLEASGRAVGLPAGQMGNSEVGHLTLGAGSVLKQDLVKISDAIESGEFAGNEALAAAMTRAGERDGRLHLLALISDGGVHSHVDHVIAAVEACGKAGVTPVVHMITDGRDTAPRCAADYLPALNVALAAADGFIATVSGRYYAMDRDNRWERIEKAWRAIVRGEGRRAATAEAAIEAAYANDELDEFLLPTVLDAYAEGPTRGTAAEYLFLNFRNDRPRELSVALAMADFEGFDRGDFTPVSLTTLTRYHADYPFPYLFRRDEATVTLGGLLSARGIRQFRSAETEKYPHVTFFFNGGRDAPYDGEDRAMADSPKVATYDLQPEMSAAEVGSLVADAMNTGEYGFIVVNFANGDMVGHTGVESAVIAAVETVDTEVGKLWDRAKQLGYSVILTADHGNADMTVDPLTGEAHTQHTTFPVPCAILDVEPRRLSNGCGLTSIAPTVLALMGIDQPPEMTGRSLLL